jgi:hypothetical protein
MAASYIENIVLKLALNGIERERHAVIWFSDHPP